MARRRARVLVIDASVAGAASDREGTSSRECTDFLRALQALKHRVALSTPLLEEWHRHETRYAATWLRSMFARKRVDSFKVEEDPGLRESLRQAAPHPRIAAIVLKDAHLIEIALVTDRRIISLDEEARKHFGQAVESVGVLSTICWVNPARSVEQPIEWLRAGARDEQQRMLGYVSSED